jgi:hypothetical protein
MTDIDLLFSTGEASVDAVLRGVIGVFEQVFPERVRGYYLTGSYADGSAMPSSDIDLTILYHGRTLGEQDERAADRLAASCALICPIELDVAALAQEIPYPLRAVSLKLDSRLLFGEDARPAVSLPSREAYARHATDLALRLLSRLHRQGPLACPIDYPEPDDPFFGYARGGTKDLATTTLLMATAILARRTDCYVAGKRECLRLYRDRIDDEWTGFIEDVYHRCRNQWCYSLPQSESDRRHLTALCARFREFAVRFVHGYGTGSSLDVPEGIDIRDRQNPQSR